MSEEAELWNKIREDRKKQHEEWWQLNTDELRKSGIRYRVASEECYIFRNVGKPSVDFYPSTGRWRVAGLSRTFSGGATKFINWYKSK